MITYSSPSSSLAGFAPPQAHMPSPAASPAVLPEVAEPPSPMTELQTSPPEPENFAMQVVVVSEIQELTPFLAAWQELADGASEPNVFYEPWMLLPALEAFAPTPAPQFHLIFSPGHGPNSDRPQLCGLFPLVREKRYKGVRTPVLRLWKHLYCAFCTPLLRRGQEVETMEALLDFLELQQGGATLLELEFVSGDGPFGRTLVEVFNERNTTTFVDECWTRALLRPQPGTSGEDYLKNAMTGKRRKEFRRKESRLGDHGAIEYIELGAEANPCAALESYIDDFLQIEGSGWKGETGSAFACDPTHQEFFRTIVREAHARGRLMLSTLRVDGQAIASKCNLLAGTGAFAFKIAFDEQYARHSPGVLLEMEVIRQIHAAQKVRWMDSCAVRNHPMINRLWTERRTLQTVVLATGRGHGEFILAGLSLLRHFKRMARRKVRRLKTKEAVTRSAA